MGNILEDLIEQYKLTRNKHVKLMSRILGGDHAAAEDVVQEAYARAIQYYGSYDSSRGELMPWFNRILFNALRDIQREYNNRPPDNIEDFSVEDVLEPAKIPSSLVDQIEAVVNEKHQRVLYLFFILGYSSREVSEIEDEVTQTNVTTIINRFKEDLV